MDTCIFLECTYITYNYIHTLTASISRRSEVNTLALCNLLSGCECRCTGCRIVRFSEEQKASSGIQCLCLWPLRQQLTCLKVAQVAHNERAWDVVAHLQFTVVSGDTCDPQLLDLAKPMVHTAQHLKEFLFALFVSSSTCYRRRHHNHQNHHDRNDHQRDHYQRDNYQRDQHKHNDQQFHDQQLHDQQLHSDRVNNSMWTCDGLVFASFYCEAVRC